MQTHSVPMESVVWNLGLRPPPSHDPDLPYAAPQLASRTFGANANRDVLE